MLTACSSPLLPGLMLPTAFCPAGLALLPSPCAPAEILCGLSASVELQPLQHHQGP